MNRWFFAMALAAVLLGGCVTAHIDYSVQSHGRRGIGKFQGKAVALAIVDLRRADKASVSSYVLGQGAYNTKLTIPGDRNDYGQVFGNTPRGESETTYYMAPDRLYWTPSGPMRDLSQQVARHLQDAGLFAAVTPLPPTTAPGAVPKDRPVLRLTINRFLSLKERRPVADTIGFLGTSALASGKEIISVDAEWAVVEAGKELASGKISFTQAETGNNFRAKNKPFRLANSAARRLTEELIRALERP